MTQRKIGLDTILKKIIKRQLPFLIGGTITGVIMTYYYGFLFSIIVNSAIWMLISFIVNKYYHKSTGFKDEKYLLQYGLAKINNRTKRTWKDIQYWTTSAVHCIISSRYLFFVGSLLLLGILLAASLSW